MGKSFVYNAGKPEPEIGTLELVYGIFFDGTKNNLWNTEIRKKVQQIEEYKHAQATPEELEIYNRSAMTRSGLWGMVGKKEAKTDDSFSNDFSNVARKYLCCEKDEYGIYIEGIGTEDINEKREEAIKKGKDPANIKIEDYTFGYALGRGPTGIIAKVKKGCKKLAEKIEQTLSNRNDKNKITAIILTLDIFGFSRGAAAARNFAYNLQKKAYIPKYRIEEYNIGTTGKFRTYIDHDNDEIENSGLLQEGVLPPFGHLGTALLEIGLERRLVESLQIRVRFIGIYDTVASYNPNTLSTDFKYYIGRLHLHELGRHRKLVHFTAMDEHRENFSLTPVKTGIQKAFPGVHSDIGGSYNNGLEKVKKLETKYFVGEKGLENFYNRLIKEYWYTKEQLIKNSGYISGIRRLRKEYSYIPLHFMGTFFGDLLGVYKDDIIIKSLEDNYSIENDPYLMAAKKYLAPYVFNEGGKPWVFLNDETWEEEKLKRKQKAEQKRQEEMQQQAGSSIQMETEQDTLLVPLDTEIENEKEIEEISVIGYDPQYLLRKLRNEYLHWSAERDWIGMDPNTDRKRREF